MGLMFCDRTKLEEAAIYTLTRRIGIEAATKKATVTTFEDTNGNLRINVHMAAMTVKGYNVLYTSLETLARNT